MPTIARPQLAPGRIAKASVWLACALVLVGCQTLPPPAATVGAVAPPPATASAAPATTPRTDAPALTGPAGPAPAFTPTLTPPLTPAPTATPNPATPEARPGLAAPVSAPDPAPAPQQAEELLEYFYQLRLMGPAPLAGDLARLEAAPPSPSQRLQLALALTHTLQLADTQRALALVQEVLESPEPGSVALRPLAHLLSHMLHEQRRLELNNERQSLQLREAQRRAEQLHDRLEAMRAIERSLNRPIMRNGGTARPTSP